MPSVSRGAATDLRRTLDGFVGCSDLGLVTQLEQECDARLGESGRGKCGVSHPNQRKDRGWRSPITDVLEVAQEVHEAHSA